MKSIIELTNNKNNGIVKDNNLKSQLTKKNIGFKKDLDYFLTLYEILYLVEKKDLKVKYKDKILKKNELENICVKKIKKFNQKYLVFKDLKEKGKIVKDGTKFGFDFRVYKNTKNHTHTEFVVDVKNSYFDTLKEVIKSERLANTINCKYVIAIIDQEKNIIKIEIKRNL